MKNENTTMEVTNQQSKNDLQTVDTLTEKIEKLEQEVKKFEREPKSLNYRLFGMMEELVGGLMEVKLGISSPWVAFRDMIFIKVLPSLENGYALDPDFISGVHIMNKVIDRLISTRLRGKVKEGQEYLKYDYDFGPIDLSDKPGERDYWYMEDSVPMILLGRQRASDDQKDWEVERVYRAFVKLKEAFSLFESEMPNDDNERIEMAALLDGILHAQGYLLNHINVSDNSK